MDFALKLMKLEDVADVIDSLHKTPQYTVIGKPMVRGTDVKYGYLDLTNTFKVNDEVFREFSRRYTPKIGDIIITRVGSYGLTAIVNDVDFCLGQNTSVIIPKINSRYLYLTLNSSNLKNQIEHSVVGSTQKTLSLKAINNLEIPRFAPKVEDKIAEILGDLDDKIELNNKMNQTLDEMAQSIFKSWFVDFDPVKTKVIGKQPEGMDAATAALFPSRLIESEFGLIPEGWKVDEIGNLVDVVGGGTPSTKTPEFWQDGDINWVTPKDFSSLKFKVVLGTERKITKAGLSKISSGLLPVGTVLLSSRAPIGYLAVAEIPLAINQGFIAMKCSKKLNTQFVLFWTVFNLDKIKERANGSTFQEISKTSFRPMKVCYPDNDILKVFEKALNGFHQSIVNNENENNQLLTIRDSLLPKLISGEIRLSDE